MQIYSQLAPLALGGAHGSAVAMGFFDGIHIGHRAVINGAVEWAKAHGAAPAVFTFRLPTENPPMPFRSPAGPAPGGGSPRMRGPATPSAEPLPGTPARRFGHRSPFARRYSGSLEIDFLSSGYLDVSVPRVVLPAPMCSGSGYPHCCGWVRPFGDPRVEGCVLLAGDYRSLPRPSSAPCAKASAVRPWYLAGPHRARGISTCR